MQTILLIYNEQNFSEEIQTYLRDHGYRVTAVNDADFFEEVAEQEKPDLIVLDALLQDMNGFELCHVLKQNPLLRDIPLLMTSAIYISEEELKTGVRVGSTTHLICADLCLMKPFKPAELLKDINYLLGKETDIPYIPQILIVDDEKNIRDLLRTTLERFGYAPVEVSTGKACLDMLHSMTPDLILLDYKLPDVSGLEVLKEIRTTLPDVGVVLMTAYGDEDVAMSAIKEHVDVYIRKPFLVENMLSNIIQTLERSRMKLERDRLIAQLRESNREVLKNYDMLAHANRRLRELDQLKSEFLANVGHELRTPLNSIIGFTELVLQGYSGKLNDAQRRQLAMVLDSGNHLLRVLNDVIEVSMLNAGQVALKYEHFAIAVSINEVLHELRSKAQKKKLRFIIDIEGGLPVCSCSHEKIRLVLYNLLDNAIKFSSSGEITIAAYSVPVFSKKEAKQQALLTAYEITGENNLVVSVSDQGIGIQQENFDILFDEFRQVDGSLTREYNGTGLGLAISKKLVELYGGRIWLESQLGVGTTFYFTVPLMIDDC